MIKERFRGIYISFLCKVSPYVGRFLTRLSPRLNTKYWYRVLFGRKWAEENPVTLNEKVLWLKINDYNHNPLVKQCADKLTVRDYIKGIGCGEILNEVIKVYEKADDINPEDLPDSFAMKLNIGCGCNYICYDKSKMNLNDIKSRFRKGIKKKYYLTYAELQYKDVKPYIIVESNLSDGVGSLPEDYKFYCFNGKCKYVMFCSERKGGTAKFFYFNRNWEMLPYTQDAIDNSNIIVPRPETIDLAFSYAEKLASRFPFVRIDLYIVKNKIYFGEMTFTPSAGLDVGRLSKTDILLGNELKLY